MTVAEQPKPRTDKRRRITGKLKTALDLMIWGDKDSTAYTWDDAAVKANFTTRAMRLALERPHVRAYLNAQRQVFREAVGARTISRLAELRDQDDNRNAAVSAARVLEQMGEEAAGGGSPGQRVQAPGFVIMVVNAAPVPALPAATIDASPLIEHRDQAEPSNPHGGHTHRPTRREVP